MTMTINDLYDVTEATWPAAKSWRAGPWILRDGQGGGKRVSAATAEEPVTEADLSLIEATAAKTGQVPLVMVRQGEDELDACLAKAGYSVIDPVNLYLAPVDPMATDEIPRVSTFPVWEPLEIMREIWATGGIGPARIAVMERAEVPKTAILGRLNDSPASTAYVGLHKGVAMLHALEVLPHQRRQGSGVYVMRRAAKWAKDQGASHIATLCTQANKGANALYAGLGMTVVGQYHYRIKSEG